MSTDMHPTAVLNPAISALREAEGRLRDAAAKAAAVGAYDAVVVISRLAKSIQAMLSDLEDGGQDRVRVFEQSNRESIQSQYENSVVHRVPGLNKAKKLSLGVPSYSRDADFLIKSARSRKTREEYEHKAPAEVARIVAECLAEWRSAKKLLTAEQLLDAYARRKGVVASYQVYVVLGWLTQIGLIRRHARSGYSVPSPNTIVHDVQKAWLELPLIQNK